MATYSEESGYVLHRLPACIPGYMNKNDILYWQGREAFPYWGKKETAKIIKSTDKITGSDDEAELEWQKIREVYDYPEFVYWEHIWREIDVAS